MSAKYPVRVDNFLNVKLDAGSLYRSGVAKHLSRVEVGGFREILRLGLQYRRPMIRSEVTNETCFVAWASISMH